mmetsp:Transcript_4821/g.12047  ORF Transcript_4821/g.12047 Transcript_4821/m.12047 type:complete len:298 (+) Transcript_4821:772-1665(+)
MPIILRSLPTFRRPSPQRNNAARSVSLASGLACAPPTPPLGEREMIRGVPLPFAACEASSAGGEAAAVFVSGVARTELSLEDVWILGVVEIEDEEEEEEEEEERRKSRAKKDAFEAAVVVLFSVLCFSCSAWRARSAETRRRCNRSDGRDEVESELPARSEAGRTRGLTPLSEFVLALPPTVALPVAPRGCAGTQIAEAEEADWEEEDDVPSDAGEPLAVTSVAEKERESLANSVLRMESLRTTRRGWLLPAGTSWLAPVATRLSLSSPGEASLPAAALLCSPLTLCSALPLVLSCA